MRHPTTRPTTTQTIDYMSVRLRFFPARPIIAPLAISFLIIAALLSLPIILMGLSWPFAVGTAVLLFALLNFLSFRSNIRARRTLIKEGLSHTGLYFAIIPVILLICSVIETCAVIPFLSLHFSRTQLWVQEGRTQTAFSNLVFATRIYCQKNAAYPQDLGFYLLDIHGEPVLQDKFPQASVSELQHLRTLSATLATRAATSDEERLIESLAHIDYFGKGVRDSELDKDILILIGKDVPRGFWSLGFTTGNIEVVAPTDLYMRLSECNVTRATLGLPAIPIPPK